MLLTTPPPRRIAPNYILAYILLALGLSLGPLSQAQAGGDKPPADCEWLMGNSLTRTMIGLNRAGFTIDATHDRITIEHKTRYPHAWARMLDRDLMMMGLYVKGPRGGRVAGFDGHLIFKLFLDYFGSRVQAVLGNWEGDSDNLAQFNGLSQRLPLEEAARKTWTGRQAVLHGYTHVFILDTKGSPGAFERVAVEFQKPR